MNKAYDRINWENYPSDATPLNETNLNKLDSATDTLDDRVITLDTTKATKTEVAALVADVTFEESTGIITVIKKNGSKITIDTQMEKIAVNFSYDATAQKIILTLIDGTKQYIDLSALITQYEFLDTDTVAFIIGTDGKVSAIVKEGSIEEKHLEPNYLAKIKVESAKAQASQEAAATSATNAASRATAAESYAVGGTGTRDGEDADNAKYYSEQAKAVYEELQGEQVTGVKGAAETEYRKGNVEIGLKDIASMGKYTGNIDDLLYSGQGAYWIEAASALGTQPVDTGWYQLEVISSTAGVIIQKAYIFSDCKTYYRMYTNSRWYEWHYCAETATKATQDGDGNVIEDTYLPKTSVVNNNTTTAAGYALDARQANPNVSGSLAEQIANKQGKLTNPLTQSDVMNVLTSTLTTKPLSAYQGKVLNEKIAEKLPASNGEIVWTTSNTSGLTEMRMRKAGTSGAQTLCIVSKVNGSNVFNDLIGADGKILFLPLAGGTMTGDLTTGGDIVFTNTGCVASPNSSTPVWISAAGKTVSALGTQGTFRFHYDQLQPGKDNVMTMGSSGYRWKQMYAGTSSIATSDRNLKDNITPLTEIHKRFFMKLIPCSFTFKDGESGRTHIGFISQDVEAAMEELGMTSLDFAGFCKDVKTKVMVEKRTAVDADGNPLLDEKGNVIEYCVDYEVPDLDEDGNEQYIYSLRYEEFIAIITYVVQDNVNRLDALETAVAELKATVGV